ncbi:hypothetical protein N7335_02010 [Stutzerimonas stutzeri]|uniref:Uncharacterized protein n=1 Tax=Stutzerimonas stutzeri TaxID=316 RepID=A0AA42H2P1_STUST|nr:hypothetical protein [Stutzerimonas stutzeri]MDH0145161.1 hypothetical protein [Stutzerimonas stutzeri]MDH0149584.1 hypothetical protein [Stutzerimonas stutzeri]
MEFTEAKRVVYDRISERTKTMNVFCSEFNVNPEDAVRLYYYKDENAPCVPGRVEWLTGKSAALEYALTKLLKERYEEDTSREHLKPFALKLLDEDLNL